MCESFIFNKVVALRPANLLKKRLIKKVLRPCQLDFDIQLFIEAFLYVEAFLVLACNKTNYHPAFIAP